MVNLRNLEKIILGLTLSCGIGCGGGSTAPTPIPSGATPPALSQITVSVYNATEGKKGEVTIPVSNGQATVNGYDLATKVGMANAKTDDVTVRTSGSNAGSYVMGGTTTLTFNPTNNQYDVYLPNSANNAPYECMPNPQLRFGKRDITIGFQSKEGATGPIEIWTDAINNINQALGTKDGKRYGSISFNPNSNVGDMTVGFAKTPQGGGAWVENGKNAYYLGVEADFKFDYNRPYIKDGAIEEIWETIFGVDDICESTGSRDIIGLSTMTGDTQWGLNPAGIDLTTRGYTNTKP